MNDSNGPYICPTGKNHSILIISISVGSAFLSLIAGAFFWLYLKTRKDKKMLQEDFSKIEQGNQIKSYNLCIWTFVLCVGWLHIIFNCEVRPYIKLMITTLDLKMIN